MNPISNLLQRHARRRTYADLLSLDDHLLRDIGISRSDVHQLINGRSSARQTAAHG
jgi:uncharacterized protein YjiS (DUF1127 family)